MIFILLIVYACLELWFPDVETNTGPQCLVHGACRILCTNVLSLSRNLSNVPVASSQFDLLLCSETLISDRHHILELLVPGFSRTVLCRDGMPRALWACRRWLHMCEMDKGHITNQNLSMAVVRYWYSGCAVKDRNSTCSVYIATLTWMIIYTIVY